MCRSRGGIGVYSAEAGVESESKILDSVLLWRMRTWCEVRNFASQKFHLTPAEVYKIRISGLESGRIQYILKKPDRIRTTVLFKLPDQDRIFKFHFFI